jgi:hypothetical protein
MPVKQVPTTNFRTATWGNWKDGVNDLRDAIKEVPGVSATVSTEVIVSGAITPDTGDILVDTEGGASADDLVVFSNWASLPENRAIRIRPLNDARTINVVHMYNNGSGGGEFVLLTGDDPGDTVSMDDTRRSMTVERRGAQLFEVRRDGFSTSSGGGSFDGNLTATLQGNNNRVTGLIWNERNITATEAPGGNYTLKVSDVGDWLNFRLDGVVTLPNPNALDADGEPWLAGMQTAAQRHASMLRAITHTGAGPNHYLNHDRAAGSVPGAFVFFKVCEANDGTLYWRIAGETTGSGGTGVPGTKERVYVSNEPADYSYTGTDLAYRNAGTLIHTPAANSKWMYFCNASGSCTQINTGNDCKFRVVNTAAPTVALSQVGRPRYVQRENYHGMFWAASYGASPTSQTFRYEVALGLSGGQVESKKISLFGMQLETDEDFGVQASSSLSIGTTYSTVATKAYTAPAGDYLVIANATIDNAGSDERYSMKLTINGTDYAATASSRLNPGMANFQTFKKITHAGGTLTATLQAKQDSSGTLTATGGVVIILKASNFEVFDYGESPAETALMASSTHLTKLSKSSALKSNWKSLVIASMQGYLDADLSGAGVAVGLNMNGLVMTYEAELTIRIQSGEPAHYAPVPYFSGKVTSPALATDVFTLMYGSQDGSTNVKVKDAVVAILALRPI